MSPVKEPLKQTALLELGTEEIPASYFAPAFSYIQNYCEKYLKEKRVAFDAVRCVGTPRRMSVIIDGIGAKSEAEEEIAWGPSVKAAKDPSGAWTQAAKGFANSKGVAVENLIVKTKENGAEHICAIKKHQGVKTDKLLSDLFTQMVPAIPFPKKMIWNETLFRFPRPIRNLICLYGSQIVKLSIAGLKAGNKTYGLSHLKPAGIKISNAANYATTLKNQCILVDVEARKEAVLKSAESLAQKVGGKLKEDADLLHEVSWLVEHPACVLGDFDKEFLKLPQEVLITCMKKHQKFFSILDSKGKLLPHFIAVRNGISEHQDIVRKGFEKVLVARLTDAQFFFSEDLKKPLDSFIEKSAAIQLQEKLGSMRDKTERMKKIGRFIAEQIKGTPAGAASVNGHLDGTLIERAVHLSKFDLTTGLVFEFPELQGIMGEIYAASHGENASVAKAIRQHYFPITVQGELPGDALSSVVAIADKIDGLVGSFLVGHLPSGSSDPYGLRRQSAGILRILIQHRWDLSLKDLVHFTLQQFGGAADEKLERDILNFLADRFQLILQDEGFAADEAVAVIKNAAQPDAEHLKVPLLRNKAAGLKAVRSHADFEAVSAAYKRAANILKQARAKSVAFSAEGFNASLIKDDSERGLHDLVESLKQKTTAHLSELRYEQALRELVSLRQALDKFFEKVMVMDPDPAIAANRLSLLAGLESLFKRVADFSLLQNRA